MIKHYKTTFPSFPAGFDHIFAGESEKMLQPPRPRGPRVSQSVTIRWYSDSEMIQEVSSIQSEVSLACEKVQESCDVGCPSTLSLVQQVPSCWWNLTLYFTQFEMRLPMKGTVCSSWTSLRRWWVSAWFWQKVSSEFVLTFSQGRKDDGHPWQRTHEQHNAIFKSAAIFGVPLQKIACLSPPNPWGHTSVQPIGRLGAFTIK